MAFPWILMLLFSVCFETTGGYRRSRCPILYCPPPPEHCQQEYNYGRMNTRWCPISCLDICPCPDASEWDLRFCENQDSRCHVYKSYRGLPDGTRCVSQCRMACM